MDIEVWLNAVMFQRLFKFGIWNLLSPIFGLIKAPKPEFSPS